MQKFSFMLLLFILFRFYGVTGQIIAREQIGQNKIQTTSGNNDTVLPKIADQDFQLVKPGSHIEYSITFYKNIDLLQTDPFILESVGLHSEIYISNTHHGVIIISSAEPNNILSDYNSLLQASPDYYDSYSRRDTLVVSTDVYNKPVFDFSRASSLRQDYKNAYNYPVDPRTGISWSKTSVRDLTLVNPYTGKYWNKNSDDFYNKEWGMSQGLNDLIIVFPKLNIK